jgi:hypothetical protein
MSQLNIVELIENNPITKLSKTYNNKLLTKIQEDFSGLEQQLFISSFYCYLNYDKTIDFVIDLDNVWKWLGFKQKIKAISLLEKHFKLDIDYKNIDFHIGGASSSKETNDKNLAFPCGKASSTNEKSLLTQQKQPEKWGGHNIKKVMLNIKCFKSLCLKAQTKKSGEIHEYYMKMEEVLYKTLEEETGELKLQLVKLEDKTNNKIKEIEETKKMEIIQNNILEHEKVLLQKFARSGSLVYIIKVKTYKNSEYVIKIGESRKGIEARYAEHKNKYDEILLLDCFSVNRSRDFESFLHNHDSIRHNKVKNLSNHETENELFLIGKNLSYSIITNIITNNINYYNDTNNEIYKLELENENLRLIIKANENGSSNNNETNLLVKQLLNKVDILDKSNKEILSKINASQTKTTTNFNQPITTLGPRLQKINPETLQLVQVYESVTECMRENNKLKRPSINKAITENTIYNGFRWLFVDRELDPNIISNIESTKKTKVQNTGYIAKLNQEQTEIVNVYLDRKTAANLNGYVSSSGLDNPVKKYTIVNGYYYKLFENCDKTLIEKFIKKNGEPILYKSGVGQFDESNNLVSEYCCKYDCIKILKMSDKTLAKAIDTNKSYNSFFYRHLESKPAIFNF